MATAKSSTYRWSFASKKTKPERLKLIIFGAAGTGKSTFGKSISKKLNWTFLDSDDYYWKKTNPPFETKIPLEIRNENLKADFAKHEKVIVSGSLCTWSKYWNTAFDLGVFLWLPRQVRMNRLSVREVERYGETLNTNKEMKEKSIAFQEWAANYDDETYNGASITQHLNWIKDLNCPVIELKGDLTNNERIDIVLKRIEECRQQKA